MTTTRARLRGGIDLGGTKIQAVVIDGRVRQVGPIADVDRYPVGEAVNFSKLPIDFGIIHYASDTPYTQARTLGARGLSYFGLDSTYASSLAIVRRVLTLEGVLEGSEP